MDKSGIYAIINKINKKRYIGSSAHLKCRRTRHFWSLANKRHENQHLQRAYNKYGKDNFEWCILEYATKEELLKIEQKYIDKTPIKLMYNIGLVAGRITMTEEIKDKIRQKLIGRTVTLEVRIKQSIRLKNKKLSVKHRENIIKSLIGHKRLVGYIKPLEVRIKQSNTMKNKKNGKCVYKFGKKYKAQFSYLGKSIYLGIFNTKKEAENVIEKYKNNPNSLEIKKYHKISKHITFFKNKWIARFYDAITKQNIYLGRFTSEIDAINAIKEYKITGLRVKPKILEKTPLILLEKEHPV